MTKIKIGFHGAARTVTGSCFHLMFEGLDCLVDCGMFQGPEELEQRNFQPFPFNPRKIDYVFLTHAHIDHCGLLPKLVREGFAGKVVTTTGTRELAGIMLLDSAKVQEEDARRNRDTVPLYTTADAKRAIKLIEKGVEYERWIKLPKGVKVAFREGGHILGAAFLEFRFREKGRTRHIVFSGDLGNVGKPIIRDSVGPSSSDVVVVEATYGDRSHQPFKETVEEFKQAVTETLERGGNVLIPSFALERTQEVLYIMREMHGRGELPPCQVFLDSPLARRATEVFRKHPYYFDEDALRVLESQDLFDFPYLTVVEDYKESLAIDEVNRKAVIIAGSGMCEGGRIRRHLIQNLPRRECSVLFVGFQVDGTLGRRLVDGATSVEIDGHEVDVRARICTINGFSAHADQPRILEWLRRAAPDRILVVHGEEGQIAALQKVIGKSLKVDAYAPDWNEEVDV